jgi:hypothetical protein
MLLARLFGLHRIRTIVWVVAANYFSMMVGMRSMDWIRSQFGEVTLLNIKQYFILAIAAYFLLSVFLELPFFAAPLFRQRLWAIKAIAGSVIAQSLSYGLLVPYYWSASGLSLVTEVTVQRDVPYSNGGAFVVFYVDRETKELCRVRADGLDRRRVQQLDQSLAFPRLYLRESPDNSCKQLWLVDEQRSSSMVNDRFARADAAATSQSDTKRTRADDAELWWSFGRAADLRPPIEREYDVETGYWPMEGLRIYDSSGERIFQLALEAPFVAWHARCATVLPRGLVVYQLEGQIVILELASRKIALLARGFGPVVVPESSLMPFDGLKVETQCETAPELGDEFAKLFETLGGGSIP